jgi:hypothetical protein
MGAPAGMSAYSAKRLWRLRKLHQVADAELRDAPGGALELRFHYNGEVAYTRVHSTMESALADAAVRRAELEREGWAFHW